ncbi:hypothetical protein F5148DRAFT_43002 [Russula earlei]|uniref:Uncharacterized protein n=1 Tax=Russula earlei TaxID=71964 RepID=A0ACC0TSS5_9AGAM|nr:hypothetical protein F5148DRAFT_43002 [Russula earlei]
MRTTYVPAILCLAVGIALSFSPPQKIGNFGTNQNPQGAPRSSSDSNRIVPKEDSPSTSPHIAVRGLHENQEELNAIRMAQSSPPIAKQHRNQPMVNVLMLYPYSKLEQMQEEQQQEDQKLLDAILHPKPEPKSMSWWSRLRGKFTPPRTPRPPEMITNVIQ